MADFREQIVDFDTKMLSDLRLNRGCALSYNFEWKRDRIRPQRDFHQLSSGDVDEFYKFIYASDGTLYGLSDVAADAISEATGGAEVTGWSTTHSATNAPESESFLSEYKEHLFWMDSGDALCHFNLSTSTVTNAFKTNLTPCTLANTSEFAAPVYHPFDDTMYFFDKTKVYSLDDEPGTGTWTTELTLPSEYEISAACVYRNFIAIAQTSIYDAGNSVVVIWDRDGGLSTTDDEIQMGPGRIVAMGELNGFLTVVMVVLDLTGTAKLVIKRIVGSLAQTINEISQWDQQGGKRGYQIIDDKLIFTANVDGSGTYSLDSFDDFDDAIGVYSVDHLGNLTCEVLLPNATVVNDLTAFYKVGDFYIMSNNNDNKQYRSLDSNFSNTYHGTSAYESRILSAGRPGETKDLKSVTVAHEPLDGVSSVKVEYRKVGETSWTTLGTNTTDDTNRTEFINVTSTGDQLPKFAEIQFRITSVGATILDAYYTADIFPDSKSGNK